MKEELEKVTGQVVGAGKELLKEHVVSPGKELLKDHVVSPGKELIKEHVVSPGKELLKEHGFSSGKELIRESAEKLREEAAHLLESMEEHTAQKNIWSGYHSLHCSSAPETLVPGCLVLEGGSFRGVYTSGVLDVLMEHGINLQTVIGTSAGALNGYNYVAGEIGRSAAINLGYRHDPRYIGARSAIKSRGVVGFNFLLDEVAEELPFNQERFDRPDRRFLATVTDCTNGEAIYCEKGICSNMVRAVQASASMPLVSEMVDVDGVPCLDGGCAVKIPYQWALDNGYEKVLVVRTRTQAYRRPALGKPFIEAVELVYRDHPQLIRRLLDQQNDYNTACDELDRLHAEGRIMMLCPSGSIEVGMLEGDMEKLGALYLLGRRDTEYLLPQIKAYLGL